MRELQISDFPADGGIPSVGGTDFKLEIADFGLRIGRTE